MKKKILFVIPSLKIGGSEKILLTILKNLNRSKFHITLAVVQYAGELIADLPNDVKIINLNSRRSRYIAFKYIKEIWSLRPDIIFSSLSHLNLFTIILKSFLPKNIKFIARETNILSRKYLNNNFYRFLYRHFYENYDLIICQSTDMKSDLIKNFCIQIEKTVVINNPCDIRDIKSKINNDKKLFNKKRYNIVSVGSLTYQKGFDLLLKTASKLNKSNFHFTIIGDGPDKDKLIQLSKKLNVMQKVDFIGLKTPPYSYMYQADLFLLTSRYEGFPNVVLESICCGTPVVSFNSPGDLSKIIINGFNGYIANYLNTNDLKRKIIIASKTKFNNKEYEKFIDTNFSVKKIVDKYQNIILSP